MKTNRKLRLAPLASSVLAFLLFASAAHAATFLVAPDDTLVRRSNAVVVVTAGESHAQWAPGGWIETVTSMRVEESVKGAIDEGSTIEVTELGGFLDGVGYAVAGSPVYAPGERMLLFLETNARGEWVAKNMAVGKFAFRTDGIGRKLLQRESSEIAGWDLDGTPHREPTRDAERFLRYVRSVAAGNSPDVDYLVPDAPRSRVASEAAASIGSYLIQGSGSSGNLGLRWATFPTAVVFLSHGSQPGATGGGVPAVQRGLGAWTNDGGSNIVYQYGGTTTIAQTGFKSGGPDGVNTVQFNDPADEIPGAFTGSGGDTLAIGGAWYGNATHTFNGEKFYTISEADLVVQNGISGAGLTGNGFDHTITHELGHTLGLRHSDQPPAGGTSSTTAIMNSSVDFNADPFGANLQAWDMEAIDAVYGASGPPPPPPCTPPSITIQPQSVSITSGNSASLGVAATGDSPLKFQWYIGTKGNTGQPVPDATVSSLTVQPAVTTSYWVRVSNGCTPAADSETAVVTVNGCPAVTIRSLTADSSIIQGTSTTLAVDATGGTLSYQWFNGTSGNTTSPVAGGTGATLSVTPQSTSAFWVRVTNSCGASANSDSVTVTVTPCTPVTVLLQPSGGSVVSGTPATLFTLLDGTSPLTVQWYQGESGDLSKPVAGATSATLVTPPLTASVKYWMHASNACGSANTQSVAVNVVSTCSAPGITQQPKSGTVSSGATTTLTVGVSGTSLMYQWYEGPVFDFTHPIGGSAPAVVTPAITSPTQFWVRISSPCGTVNSVAATISPQPVSRHRGVRH